MINQYKKELLIDTVFYPKPKKRKKTEFKSKYYSLDLYFKYFYNPKLSNQLNFEIRNYYLKNYDLIQLKYKKKFTYFKKKRKSKKEKLQSIYDSLNELHNFKNPLKVLDWYFTNPFKNLNINLIWIFIDLYTKYRVFWVKLSIFWLISYI